MRAWYRAAPAAIGLGLAGVIVSPRAVAAQDSTAVRTAGDSVSIRFVDTDIRAAIQALGRYLSKPVLVGAIEPRRVTLETPAAVSRDQIPALLRGLVESQGLTLVEDSVFFRVEVLPPGVSVDKSQGGAGGQVARSSSSSSASSTPARATSPRR